jgi:hypothetical protein
MSRCCQTLGVLLLAVSLSATVEAQGPGGGARKPGGNGPPAIPGHPAVAGQQPMAGGEAGAIAPGTDPGTGIPSGATPAELAAAYTARLIERFDTDGDQALNQAELLPCLEMLYAEAQAQLAQQAAQFAALSQSGAAGPPAGQAGAAQFAPGSNTTEDLFIGTQPTPQGRQPRSDLPGGPGGAGGAGGGGGGRGGN